MLHPLLLRELLDDELQVATSRLGTRAEQLHHDGRYVRCRINGSGGQPLWLRLDAATYDRDPCGVDVCDDDGATAPHDAWPSGLSHGIHPVHQRPWVCARGTAEYFTYPGHHSERWDAYRATLRIADLLDHLLRRAGRP